MRVFEIQPGGSTPYHTHPYAHEALILHGAGVVRQEDSERAFREGDVVSIAPYEPHSFVNNTGEILKFLCMNYVIAEVGGRLTSEEHTGYLERTLNVHCRRPP